MRALSGSLNTFECILFNNCNDYLRGGGGLRAVRMVPLTGVYEVRELTKRKSGNKVFGLISALSSVSQKKLSLVLT